MEFIRSIRKLVENRVGSRGKHSSIRSIRNEPQLAVSDNTQLGYDSPIIEEQPRRRGMPLFNGQINFTQEEDTEVEYATSTMFVPALGKVRVDFSRMIPEFRDETRYYKPQPHAHFLVDEEGSTKEGFYTDFEHDGHSHLEIVLLDQANLIGDDVMVYLWVDETDSLFKSNIQSSVLIDHRSSIRRPATINPWKIEDKNGVSKEGFLFFYRRQFI